MNKRDLRNSDVELIYIYIERIADGFNNDIYTNISLNLSSNIVVAYDYENGLLMINKKKIIPDDFWSLKQNMDTNITNNVLILGENGIGKTTLLEMIYAGNLESIEGRLGNYMLLYTIKGSDKYYIKSAGLKWIDRIDLDTCSSIKLAEEKSPVKNSDEFYSCFCRMKKPNKSIVKGYFGLISVDCSGKIGIDEHVIEMDTAVQRKEHWTRMPMNGIYLPTSITENEETGRFVSRKRIHHENIVTNSDITEFIIKDMQKEEGIIKSNPYLSFSNITVKDLCRNKKAYNDDFKKVYNYLGMNSMKKSEIERKYQFFAIMWIAFMLRLYENQFLDKNFVMSLKRSRTYKAIYDNIKSLFPRLFKYRSNQLNERYQNLLQAVERLDEKIFECSIFTPIPFGLSWSVPIGTIAKNNEWSNQIMEFIKLKDEFESNLQWKIQKKMNWDYIPNFMMNHYISNMSSGETILISNVFSKISKNMKMAANRVNEPHSVLLIMDEPDCTFHIRWTQQFVKYLIEFLNTHYPGFSFQIIMTSHMPFLATDYPRGNIICIPSDDWIINQDGNNLAWLDGRGLLENKEMYNSFKAFAPNYGFMSNYYDVVKDDFFVDVPIGIFAQNRFNDLKKKVDSITECTSKQELKNIEMEIELIDEPVLKKYVYDDFRVKIDLQLGRDELEKEAELLEKRLEEINKRLIYMKE